MWIKFDLEGMRFDLKIDGYRPNQDLDGEWTNVSFSFKFHNIIDYKIYNAEILLSCEVDSIIDDIKDLLDDKLEKSEEYEPCEPDLTFIFNPKYDIRNNPNVTYVAPGCEIQDINIELRVNLWDGGLTSNYFSMTLDRKDIEKLYTYLCYVTKKINRDNPKVVELMNKGIIYG